MRPAPGVAYMSVNPAPEYVLGHSDRELLRLEQQAAFFSDATSDVLTRCGLARGQKVLDLGCGVGDVSSIAAELVGETGRVVGIDISPDAIALASARLKALGKAQASFKVSSIEAYDGYAGFDAVIGRFILVHNAEPRDLIRPLLAKLRPGAIVSFIEMDMSSAAAVPPLPLLGRCVGWIVEAYRRAGRNGDTGSSLYAIFRDCGLEPKLAGYTRIAGSGELAGIGFVVESLRSLTPLIVKLGVATAEEIGIETLGQRLLAEAGDGGHCVFYPRLVGAWATVGSPKG